MVWKFNQYADNVAIIDESGCTIQYSELEQFEKKISNVIKERCLLFSLCTNTIGSIVGYLAFVNMRLVPALLNSHLDRVMLENLIDKYSPKYLWVPVELESQFKDFEKVLEAYEYVLLSTNIKQEYELFDELALLLTTSGSTGSPKFVRQSYTNLKENAKSIVEYLELKSGEKAITTLPMNYTYGLSIINSHMLVGATIIATEKSIVQKEFWECFKKNEATSLAGVPYTYEMLDRFRFYRMKLPSLRYMTQAGGKLAPELHKKFARYAIENNKQFIVMYGQCEATARMAYLPSDKSLEKFGSVGIPIPDGEFELVDENGEIIHDAEVIGELMYKGKNVTLGYAENGYDLKKGDERRGILLTGDLAKKDEDGFYYIVGRKKRFLKIYGNRVNLDEVDSLIKEKFHYIDCASTGKDDDMIIFVTDEELVESVRKYISEITRLNMSAFQVRYVQSIPKNESGKTLYHKLEKLSTGRIDG